MTRGWRRLPPARAAMELLIRAGASVSARDQDGDTPLHIAAANEGFPAKALQWLLLQPGVELDARNKARMSPGEVAVAKGNTAAARALYDAGADMADPDWSRC